MRASDPFAHRVVAIDPFSNGFAFAVLDGPTILVDWGVARVWAKSDKEFLARVEPVMLRYRPVVLVLMDRSRLRASAVTRRAKALAGWSVAGWGVPAVFVTRGDVQAVVGRQGMPRYEIACALAEIFPEIADRLPAGRRRPWAAEDVRMQLFDAVGVGVAWLTGDAIETANGGVRRLR